MDDQIYNKSIDRMKFKKKVKYNKYKFKNHLLFY